MPETSPHSLAMNMLESLTGQKETRKRALFIRDDSEGRGRRLYKQIRNELEKTGLAVFELSDFQSLEGRFFEAGKTGSAMAPGASMSEQSLFSALRILQALSALQKEKPFVLSLQDTRRWNARTALFVRLLLEADDNGSYLTEGREVSLPGIILALEEDYAVPRSAQSLDSIVKHPSASRLADMDALSVGFVSRTLDSRSIRPLRLCQLAYLPLRLTELQKVHGRDAIAGIRRCGVDVIVEGGGPTATIFIADGISPYLSDPSTLPQAQLAEYHGQLLQLFEEREETEAVVAGRFHHAVKASNGEALLRWLGRGIDVLVRSGKADEAAALLRESLLAVVGQPQHAGAQSLIRRRLADLYAGSGRPIQAFETLCGGDFRNLTIDDWYVMAQAALEAGHLKQSQEAIDTVLNGNYLDPRKLLPFKVLQCEIEYLKGRYDASLRACHMLLHERPLSPADRLKLLNTEGKVYLVTRQFKKAEKIFSSNNKTAAAAGLHRQAVISMINIAVSKIRLGHYPLARQWLDRALKEARRRLFYREEAIALENIATIHHLERRYQKALSFYSKALEILKYLDCHELLARVANNMGELYLRFGEVDRAGDMLRYSRGRLDEMRGSLVEGEGLLLSGRIQMGQANYSEAERDFERAEIFFCSSRAEHLAVEAALLRAGALLGCGRADEAGALIARAEPLLDGSPRLQAMMLLARARVCSERCEDCMPDLTAAVKAFRSLADREGEFESFVEMARLLMRRGDAKDASKALRKAESVNHMIRCDVPEDQIEKFDGMPMRRLLETLKRSVSGRQRPKRRGGDKGSGGNGGSSNGNNGNDDPFCDIMESGESDAPGTTALLQKGANVDLRVLLSEGISLSELKERIEKNCIEQAMVLTNGNISKAASLLGMKRPRLSQLVKQYKLNKLKKG
jgi:tetratricopeptide (TPR) repeat protein